METLEVVPVSSAPRIKPDSSVQLWPSKLRAAWAAGEEKNEQMGGLISGPQTSLEYTANEGIVSLPFLTGNLKQQLTSK